MAENSSTSPATAGNTTITGSTGVDSLSGGGGSDTIIGDSGADRLSGDAPLAGQWQFSVYTRDFSSANNQTQFISSGTLVGNGYVDDFGVRAIRNTLSGTPAAQDRDDYGVIYRSNLAITTGGTYTFSTSSDDGSRIIIRDSSGNIVMNLDNDFHQGVTTRSATAALVAGQTYSIEVYFWENAGGDSLSATIAGPGLASTNLATSTLLTTPPLAPGHVDGADSILGDAGDDTITGGGGADRLYGGADVDSILGEAGQDQIYGGDGGDRLFGGLDGDLVYGGLGADTIDGGAAADTLYGDDGDDSILGDTGTDSIFGGIGDDRLYGGAENDTLVGDAGLDHLYGGDGADQLSGGAGADTVYGGIDTDTVYGGSESDSLYGDAGNDSLFGGAGGDSQFGGADRDRFSFADGDFGVGDSVDGGSAGNDFDVLDLSGYGWARTDVTYTTPNRENGYVDFFSATGTYLGRMFFTEIEEVIPCFTAGTLIDTPTGPRPVEEIQAGDPVLTRDDGAQVVRWIGHRKLGLADLMASPELQPVTLKPGALGPDLPEQTLTLSPQHRVLLLGPFCELFFAETEVLAPAVQLVGSDKVFRTLAPVTYVHLMFDRHQIVRTHGVWSESFQPGAGAVQGLPDLQRDELFKLFPELAAGMPYRAARPTLKAHETRILLQAGL